MSPPTQQHQEEEEEITTAATRQLFKTQCLNTTLPPLLRLIEVVVVVGEKDVARRLCRSSTH